MLWCGVKKRLNFGFWPKNQTQFRWKPFFLETTCFWAEKNVWISVFGRKIRLNFGENLFFLETTWFWAEKTFEIPSFPRNFVSIFGQTVWNWFKNNENSGQGRLYFSHSFKKVPPFSKSWLRAWAQAVIWREARFHNAPRGAGVGVVTPMHSKINFAATVKNKTWQLNL